MEIIIYRWNAFTKDWDRLRVWEKAENFTMYELETHFPQGTRVWKLTVIPCSSVLVFLKGENDEI